MKNVIRNLLKKIFLYIPSSAILMFHHLSSEPKVKKSGCVLDEKKFYDTINSFERYDTIYNVIKKPHKRKFALTFDDALEDVYTIAYPFLKSKNIPFTIFVITDLLDTEGYITTNQLIEMSKDDLVTIGSHGVTHEVLPKLSIIEIKNELNFSKNILEELINKKIDIFAYSHGQFNEETIKLAKTYKYVMSVRNLPLNLFTKNKNLLPRIGIDNAVYLENMKLLKNLKNNVKG